MINLETRIQEINEELSTPINKTEFLAECALKKIKKRSSVYDKEITKYLNFLEKNEINSQDLTRITNTLTALSSLITQSYNGLISMISQCEKNIFKK